MEDALSKICEFYVLKALEIANDIEKRIINESINNSIKFSSIFCHDSDKNDIQNLLDKIRKIAVNLEEKEEITNRDPVFYINRIFTLVTIYEEFYVPIVELETPLEERRCLSLICSVENLRKSPMTLRWFLLTGILPVSIDLEIEQSASNHIRIFSPKGLVFRHACISGIEGTRVASKYGDLKEFLDDSMIYFYIAPEDAKEIHELRNKSTEDKIFHNDITPSSQCETTTDKKKKGPTIEISMGISRNSPKRPSLIRILTTMMYISIFVPSIALFVFNSHVDSSLIIETMILEVTILVSLGVYSMDKPFLHEYIGMQVVILLFLFIVELFCLLFFT